MQHPTRRRLAQRLLSVAATAVGVVCDCSCCSYCNGVCGGGVPECTLSRGSKHSTSAQQCTTCTGNSSGGGGTSGTAQTAVPLPTPPPPLSCRSISVLPTPTPSACAALRSSASPNAGRSRRLLCARHPQRLAHLYTPSSPPSSPPPPCDTASLPTPGQSPLARGGHPRAACPPWLLYLARVVRGSGSSSSSSSSSGSSSGTCAVGSTCRCATGAGGSFAHVHRQLRQTIRIYTYSHFTPNMYNLHGYLLLLR